MMYASWISVLLFCWGGCLHPAPPPASSTAQAQPKAPALNLAEVERWVDYYINQARQDHHLNTLEPHTKLARVARHHSQDMAEHDFFDHINLRGERPHQRAQREGITCGLGENLYQTYQYDSYKTIYSAGQVTVEYDWKEERRIASDTVTAWLESPTHRTNLLSRSFTSHGIGVALSSSLKVYVTQNMC